MYERVCEKDTPNNGDIYKDAQVNQKIMNARVGTVATESAGLGIDLYGRAATIREKDEC